MERLGKLDVRKTTMQERYSRHILLKEIGEKRKKKLFLISARVGGTLDFVRVVKN